MTGKLITLACSALFAGAAAQAARGQTTAVECAGPVYEAKEVTRRAVLVEKPEPGFTEEARANGVSGKVTISAVLCGDGRVTDIRVGEGLPHGMTERAVEAARRIKFRPAKKDGRAVSQWLRIEYLFDVTEGDDCRQKPGLCAGLLVQTVGVQGNRRMKAAEILSRIKTKPGDVYDPAQVQRDLQALLEPPNFDPAATFVSMTDGAGGVVVIFTVMERPIIRDIAFDGLESAGDDEVRAALRERIPGFVTESPYDAGKAEHASRVIRDLLAARGLPNSTVEVRVEEVSAVSVALTFVVKERR